MILLVHDDVDVFAFSLASFHLSFWPFFLTSFFPSLHAYMIMDVIWYTVILYGLSATSSCNQDGYTAMMLAADNGHKDIVEYLVSQGADKDIKTDVSTTLVHEHLYKMIYLYISTYVQI